MSDNHEGLGMPPVEETLDGVLYEMDMLPATRSWKLFRRLVQMVGPSFGSIIDAVIQSEGKSKKLGKLLEDIEITEDFASKGIAELVDRMSESELGYIIGEFRRISRANNRSLETAYFDIHFQGKFPQLCKWLGWCIAMQYFPFIFALLKERKRGEQGQKTPVQPESPSIPSL